MLASAAYVTRVASMKRVVKMMTAEAAIPIMVERIVDGFDPIRVTLFGSRARGDFYPRHRSPESPAVRVAGARGLYAA